MPPLSKSQSNAIARVHGPRARVATDIYGLGVTLCHLLLPNHASPEIAIKLDFKLPGSVRELLVDMTAAEPGQRPNA